MWWGVIKGSHFGGKTWALLGESHNSLSRESGTEESQKESHSGGKPGLPFDSVSFLCVRDRRNGHLVNSPCDMGSPLPPIQGTYIDESMGVVGLLKNV